MPPNRTCPTTIHIRDFIDCVESDPTCPSKNLALQLRLSLNILDRDEQFDDVTQADIPTLIRFFSQTTRSEIYQPNVFIYAWGSFLTAMHCPEAAQPTVIFLGTVCERGGQRWVSFPSLSINAQVFITGRIFGLTKENQQLASMTEDVHFLPAPPQPLPPTPSSTLGKRKRTDQWTQRATLAPHPSPLTNLTIIHHLITATRTKRSNRTR
ncbi:hypothetical protein BDV37DRAFT_289763 [Aspergillus pseudonomiae]|uniref:Uncharacterized protein n=1 Tax=Aspergillus pseudonomiae TaxID=1506151 RepID=A0A5N7CS23_9EURO|nr:uncharacterized protein BDV37DRAFT_289763 [Aspergillus pseudonomiae]KAE8397042.1 hypothetical protein BDV37DRAFT_289763 [Aspergillus pseudonomiae]